MNSVEPIVFVVDDEPSVRKALARLLNAAGYTAETFASGAEFLTRRPYPGVGCIILDLRLPGASGLDLQQRLGAASCVLPVIFVSGHGDIPASVRAIKAGALDFLQKPFTDTQLLTAVDSAIGLCRRRLKAQGDTAEIRNRYAGLTSRECEVLAGVIASRLNKQIAADLGIVEQTVKVHRGRVMRKMQAQSVADLVRMANQLPVGPANPPAQPVADVVENAPGDALVRPP